MLDYGPAITLQRMQRVRERKRWWVTIERDISPRPYRLFSNAQEKNQCAAGRGFSRCPPFREGVKAETLFCANTSTARLGQVGGCFDGMG